MMATTDPHTPLSQGQAELRRLLKDPSQHAQALELFLHQHARLHARAMAETEDWSFEDEIFEGLTDEQARCIPPGFEHSIAWNLWHIARIEDIAMNLLVVGQAQIVNEGGWQGRLRISACDTGNSSTLADALALSATIDLRALRAYRLAVGRQTRRIIRTLTSTDLQRKVDPARLERVRAEGAVVAAAADLLEYWSKRTITGLLLMPATRHPIVHLNECARIKEKVE